MELIKTKTDLNLAQEMLKEYPRTKWFARISFAIVIILALKELYELIIK